MHSAQGAVPDAATSTSIPTAYSPGLQWLPELPGFTLVQGPCVVPGGDRGRWSSRLRVGASVRRNGDNGQGGKFHERFHRDSPIPAWLRPARNEALVALSALYQGNRLEPLNLIVLTQVESGLRAYRQAVLH